MSEILILTVGLTVIVAAIICAWTTNP